MEIVLPSPVLVLASLSVNNESAKAELNKIRRFGGQIGRVVDAEVTNVQENLGRLMVMNPETRAKTASRSRQCLTGAA